VSGRPLTFSLLQMPHAPDRWRTVLSAAEDAGRAGLSVTAQVCSRPVGVLIGLELSTNPFSFCPSYRQIAQLPFAERLVAMRDPQLRKAIISEYPAKSWEPIAGLMGIPDKMFLLTEAVNYEPKSEDNVVEAARRHDIPIAHYLYDLMIEGDGRNILYIPAANYVDGKMDAIETMLRSKVTVPGLGDGGAHCGSVCDASLTTYRLLRWADEAQGPFSLPAVVKALTVDSAAAVELNDRGRIAVGLRGDLNVIDMDRLSLGRPGVVYDLPSGGGRLDQRAEGYVATIVAGQVTYRNGEATGALPGRLVRGTRPDGRRAAVPHIR
jgi:N-acyl-D-amino-acid deacylase